MTMLEGLRWRPYWVAHLGCIQGCLEYCGVSMPKPWLFGGTGHAFIINLHPELCPSGPTAWNTSMLFRLAPNLGYRVTTGCAAWKSDDETAFRAEQLKAWDFVKTSIDQGQPCYGWQLEIPEYYVIHGYDDTGYYYSGCTCLNGDGPLPWGQLGDSDVSLIEVHSVALTDHASDEQVVKDALTCALKHATCPPEWIAAPYTAGPDAFDVWASALETGRANRDGLAFNTGVWHECRTMASEFLLMAQERLPGVRASTFTDTAAHYRVVRDRLQALAALFPMRAKPDFVGTVASAEGAALVREAGIAERQGLTGLQAIVEEL